MTQDSNQDVELSNLLFNAVNEQGYIFQEACEHALHTSEKDTGWEIKAKEYVVSFGGQDTRVDIILRTDSLNSSELYALVECKRADPSYNYWVFCAPHLPHGEPICSVLGLQCSEVQSGLEMSVNRPISKLHFSMLTYTAISWLEVKRGHRNRTSTPQNIENAFRQVFRGIAGLAQEQLAQREKGRRPFQTYYIPVVVTTAKLYVAAYAPKHIDIKTGKISKDKISFGPIEEPAQEVSWVVVNYGQIDDLHGRSLSIPTIPTKVTDVDPSELQKYKNRDVFIVNSSNVASFFSKLKLKNIY